MRKNSASTPVLTCSPSLAASSIRRRSTLRGACATSSPSITQLAATQATSGFHGSWITDEGSGTASMSGWAGVISSHVAKPAKPAPSSCISAIACAGTSFARCPPNRSVNEIIKYLTPFSAAKAAKSCVMDGFLSLFSHVARMLALCNLSCRAGHPGCSGQRYPCHGSRFNS